MDLGITATACEEIRFRSIGTSPLLINREGTKLGAIGKADSLRSPIHVRIMLSQPCVTEDKVVMTEVTDIEGDNFMMSVCFHGE